VKYEIAVQILKKKVKTKNLLDFGNKISEPVDVYRKLWGSAMQKGGHTKNGILRF